MPGLVGSAIVLTNAIVQRIKECSPAFAPNRHVKSRMERENQSFVRMRIIQPEDRQIFLASGSASACGCDKSPRAAKFGQLSACACRDFARLLFAAAGPHDR